MFFHYRPIVFFINSIQASVSLKKFLNKIFFYLEHCCQGYSLIYNFLEGKVISMLHKYIHNNYMVSVQQFVNNSDYLLKVNDKAKKVITLKKGKEIVGVVFTPNTFQKTDAEIEKIETAHQMDQHVIKDLKKENETLKARIELLEKLNHPHNDNDIPF